ncbi:MAG: hypothetical protein H6609_20830 [Ignavibacteriales bacterium]|nr:hypothetical protein [Ignavibacteriales bacterium]
MKKQLNSKLSLKKEKISILEADDLDKVYGGKPPQTKGDGDTGGTNGLCCSDDEQTCTCTEVGTPDQCQVQ